MQVEPSLMQGESVGKYYEEWEIYVSGQKEPYIINEVEHEILIEASKRGIKGLVRFEKFEINPAFIVSTYRKSRKLKPEYMPVQIDDGKNRQYSREERVKNIDRLNKMKKDFGI